MKSRINEYEVIDGIVRVDISTSKHVDKVMLISPEDWDALNRMGMGRISAVKKNKCGTMYAQCRVGRDTHLVHRLLLPDSICVDHENGDGLDNLRSNIRSVTQLENGRNQRLSKCNTSGICGVQWLKAKSKWAASIRVSGKLLHLGYFHDIDLAANARMEAEVKYNFHANHGR
jgi:hypothetical protein